MGLISNQSSPFDTFDVFDKNLLAKLESAVPLIARPFDQIASELGQAGQFIIERIKALRGPGKVIREISGIFDATALGYGQSLIAMSIGPDRLDQAGKFAATHPGVSHCYSRDGNYNLWLTLAVSPQSSLGLEGTAAAMAQHCHANSVLVLPAIKKYKLRVRLASSDQAPQPSAASEITPATLEPPNEIQIKAIRALGQDLPAVSEPFVVLGDHISMSSDELLGFATDFLAAGWLRRYSAVLYHRAAGATENVMVAWAADPAIADTAGAACRRISQVSHCYLRESGPDWPYNFYTMIHGRSRAECIETVDQIAIETALDKRQLLWSATEYKKKRIALFDCQEANWEQSCR